MKIKNVNPVERHAEKIALAVAGAAMLYLIYSAWTITPTVQIDGTAVGPGEVESRVSAATRKLKSDMLARKNELQLNLQSPDFIGELMHNSESPIPDNLLQPVPRFAPEQLAFRGNGRDIPGQDPLHEAVAIDVPPPADVQLTSSRGNMMVPAPSAGAAGSIPAAADVEPRDISWVKVQATYPVAELRKAINSSVPDTLRRVTFYKVIAERQKLTDAAWGPWEKVTAANPEGLSDVQLGGTGQQVKSSLDYLDQNARPILEPRFYDAAEAPAAEVPVVAPGRPDRLNPRRGGNAPAAGGPPANLQAVIAAAIARAGAQAQMEGGQGIPPMVLPGPAAAQPGAAPELDLEKTDHVDIWMYDTSVEPGAHYRYRLAVEVFNPFIGTRGGPWLTSPWSAPSEAVRVSPMIQFFAVQGIGGGRNAITLEIYRWASGKWAKLEQASKAGLEVGRQNPAAGVTGTVDFRTGNYVVDSQPFSGFDSLVVLANDQGRLFLRDARIDEASEDRKSIIRDSAPPKPAPVAPTGQNPLGGPGAAPGGGMPPYMNPGTPPARPAPRIR